MKKNKTFYLSASTYKLYSQCTLKYYYAKCLKVPENTNQGALAGSVTHETLECLLNPKRRDKVLKLIETKNFSEIPAIPRLVRALMRKYNVNQNKFEAIINFIWTALNMDFLSANGDVVGIEVDFEIKNKKPKYAIRGFIDYLVKYGKFVRCRDWKTNQSGKFEGKDIEHNIQGLIYCLAATKLYPDLLPVTDFHFLVNGETQRCDYSKPSKMVELKNFEKELAEVYKQMSEFSPENRFDNVAANQGFSTDGSFSGRMMCGRAKFKGEMKKDGSKQLYHCPYKFEVDYFKLCDSDGELIKTAFTEEELKPHLKEGQFIIAAKHLGCEIFKK